MVKGKECLAFWVKACATTLPYQTTQEKEILLKEFTKKKNFL